MQKNVCTYCSGRLASKEKNLKVLNPELTERWHPTKNGDLAPENTSQALIKRFGGNAKKIMSGRPMYSTEASIQNALNVIVYKDSIDGIRLIRDIIGIENLIKRFAWYGKFEDKNEIDHYFDRDKNQCLLCGE